MKPCRLLLLIAALAGALAQPAEAHGDHYGDHDHYRSHDHYHSRNRYRTHTRRAPRERLSDDPPLHVACEHTPLDDMIVDDSGLRDDRGRLMRSREARAAFQCGHPCPSTGEQDGPCPGYVVDHIVALKRGGADLPSNMQWQTIEAAKEKDRIE